jgi:hypothetical protein
MERISQNGVRLRKTLAEHETRVCGGFGLEKLVEITNSHAIAFRNHPRSQIAVMQVSDDIGLDRGQPGRALLLSGSPSPSLVAPNAKTVRSQNWP